MKEDSGDTQLNNLNEILLCNKSGEEKWLQPLNQRVKHKFKLKHEPNKDTSANLIESMVRGAEQNNKIEKNKLVKHDKKMITGIKRKLY